MYDIVIKPFMLSELRLEGKELLIYAILYDSMKYGIGYTGDLDQLARDLNIQKKTLFACMKKLHERGLIDKKVVNIDNKQIYAFFVVTEATERKKVAKKTNPRTEEVREVFEYWKEARGKGNNVQLTDTRRAKIRTRLDKYSVEDIKRAIDNINYSSFHNGNNPEKRVYDDIELICRNDDVLEKWITYRENAPKRHFLATTASGILEEEQMTEERLLWLEAIQYVQEIEGDTIEIYKKAGDEFYEVGNFVYIISSLAREDYNEPWAVAVRKENDDKYKKYLTEKSEVC